LGDRQFDEQGERAVAGGQLDVKAEPGEGPLVALGMARLESPHFHLGPGLGWTDLDGRRRVILVGNVGERNPGVADGPGGVVEIGAAAVGLAVMPTRQPLSSRSGEPRLEASKKGPQGVFSVRAGRRAWARAAEQCPERRRGMWPLRAGHTPCRQSDGRQANARFRTFGARILPFNVFSTLIQTGGSSKPGTTAGGRRYGRDAAVNPEKVIEPGSQKINVKPGSIDDVSAVGNRDIGGRGMGNWYSTDTEIKMGKMYAWRSRRAPSSSPTRW
jgi:hypothetical protein